MGGLVGGGGGGREAWEGAGEQLLGRAYPSINAACKSMKQNSEEEVERMSFHMQTCRGEEGAREILSGC